MFSVWFNLHYIVTNYHYVVGVTDDMRLCGIAPFDVTISDCTEVIVYAAVITFLDGL